jgi:hypothetical protein
VENGNLPSINENMLNLLKAFNDFGTITNRIINKPTTIGKVFPCSYYVDKTKIETLYKIIETKINTVTNTPIEFEIGVYYDDKTYIPYKSMDAFINDNETRALIAKSIKLKWGTNIFFPNRNNTITQVIGERHDIEITFSLSPAEVEEEAYYIFNGYPVKGLGVVDVSITHSNKIWAIEIMSHIEDFIKTIKIQHNKFIYFLFNKRRRIAQFFEKLFDFSVLIPLSILLFKGEILNRGNILFLASFSALLFIICNLFSYPLGKFIFKTLSKLQQNSYIDINGYTNNFYRNSKGRKNIILLIITLILVPIIVNIISALICKKIGL